MFLKYRDLDSFAYAISERTKLSQPQAELYINAGLLTGFVKEHGQFVIADDRFFAINADGLLQYKPYTLENLAEKLGYEEIDVRRVLEQGLLPASHSSGRMYLYTDDEMEVLKQKFPEFIEKAYDMEQKAEQEEESGLLSSRELSLDGLTSQRIEGEEQGESPGPYGLQQGGEGQDIGQKLQEDNADADGPEVRGRTEKKKQMHNRHNNAELDKHAIDYSQPLDREDAAMGSSSVSDSPYEGHSACQRQSPYIGQSADGTAETASYPGKEGDAEHAYGQPSSYAAHYQPIDYSGIGQNNADTSIDSTRPDNEERGQYGGAYRYGASAETDDGFSSQTSGLLQMQGESGYPAAPRAVSDQRLAYENTASMASWQPGSHGNEYMPSEGYENIHGQHFAMQTLGLPASSENPAAVTNQGLAGNYQMMPQAIPEGGKADGLSGVRQDSDTIISHAEQHAVLFYGDDAVLYVSKESRDKDGRPVSVETHDPMQMDNMYHQLMDAPDQLRAGEYALHLANGEKIAVTEDDVHKIKSKPISTDNSQELARYEQSAFVDAEGRKTRVFGIAGAEDFSVSSSADNEKRTQAEGSLMAGEKNSQGRTEWDNPEMFRVRQKKRMDRDVFSTIGSMAFRQSFGGLGAYAGYRTVKRYAGWVNPVAMGTLKRAELKSYEKVFRANNELGNIDHALRNAGVKGDILKNRNGKYKKQLSDKEVKYLMNQLREKFKGANLGNADLGKMSDKELKNLLRKLSGKDHEIVKCYADLKNIAQLRGSQIGLVKRTRKLLDIFGNALNGADFYEGIVLSSRYAGLTMRMVKYGAASVQWTARKVVRPYGRMVDRREARKAQAVRARQGHRIEKKARRKTKRRVARHRRLDRLSVRLTGQSVAGLKMQLSTTRVGRGVGAVRGKLKPVMKIKKQAFGAAAKVFGKTFNLVGKFFSAPRKIALWLLVALAKVFLILVVITLMSAAVLSALNVIPESDNIMDDGKTVVLASADSLLANDNAWYRGLMEIRNETTPEEANDGNKVYGGRDPFSGQRYEITSFSGEPVYKYYDGRGFAYIAGKGGKVLDKDALSRLPQINLYSNAKAIMSAAAVYRHEVDIGDQDYIDFCGQLWNHTHAYKSAIGSVYMCSGCKSRNIACYKKGEYNAYTNALGDHYNFLPGISNAAAAGGCYTYYCNNQSSCQAAVHKKDNTRVTYSDADKGCKTKRYANNFMAYCSFSGKTSDNPKITDCPNVSNEIKAAYHANGSYRDIPLEQDNKAATDFDECTHARDFHIGDGIAKSAADAACARNEIVIVKKDGVKVERTYQGRKFWLGYCPDMSALGTQKQCGGYFLVGRSSANLTGNGSLATNIYASAGQAVWFYECQGHVMKERRFSYCLGHAGCKGHNVAYCLGHCNLEVYASIAGLNDDELENEAVKDNLFAADNYFFAGRDGTYSPDWEGYSDDHVGHALMILDNDWDDLYGLPDSKFVIDTSTE